MGEKFIVKVEVEDVPEEHGGDMQGFSDVGKGKNGTAGKGKGKQLKPKGKGKVLEGELGVETSGEGILT